MDRPFTSLVDLICGLACAMNLISPEAQDRHQKVAYLSYRTPMKWACPRRYALRR